MSNQEYYQGDSNWNPPQGGGGYPAQNQNGQGQGGQAGYYPQDPNRYQQQQQYQPYGQYDQNNQQYYQAPHHQHQHQVSPGATYPQQRPSPGYTYPQTPYGEADAPPPPYNHQPPQQAQYAGPNENGPDGERGVMGALAGGAAGAYGGHKFGGDLTGHSKTSTVFGALAGAYAGHKLQDGVSDWHDKRKEEKKEEKEKKKKKSHSRSRSRSRERNFAGNFSHSSEDIHLEDEHSLVARCWPVDGGPRLSSMNLNQYLTNNDGRFEWTDGDYMGNFSGSARHVRLKDGQRLEAELCRQNGDWVKSRVNLDEKITNNNGSLQFLR